MAASKLKNLVIVESPAKAKTIEGFLGKDYVVKSCFGHIRDLSKDDDAVDVNHQYQPKYEIPAEKKQLVSELKKLAKDADTVWLASDEDREGEAISWHLYEVLNLNDDRTKRIVFHEITKNAILNAIAKPRTIDKNLVDAQQARRVLDRLVGYELSPILWKKVKPSLSAGRVQSVAVRLIVEREREIHEFNTTGSFKITARFQLNGGKILEAELPHRFATREEALKFLESCVGASFKITNIETKPGKKSPAPPFTTSTLQQEASRKLSFSVSQTMLVAQKLYEAGHITYMRTDSVNLSEQALDNARREIVSQYGQEYHQLRKYTTKSASAQEAHEAIRPTHFENHTISGDNQERRLYDLIWKRAIASQMSDARLEKTVVDISISGQSQVLNATGEVLKFDGFLKVYMESSDEEGDEEQKGMLPPLNIGEVLNLEQLQATERFSRPPARYTEASLVKKLEENGIGRPSTYAPTISTIQKRGYVVKEDREGKERIYQVLTLQNGKITQQEKTEVVGQERSKLFPSDIGMVVTDFLLKYFHEIMDYGFTASVEKDFDEIARGQIAWYKMIDDFYKPFHKTVEKTTETAERAKGERVIGVDPVSKKQLTARIGRYGPIVQLGDPNSEEKPTFASLRAGQTIETITLEEALDLFKLPRTLGLFEDKEVKVSIGRFGPYIQHNSKFISLKKEDDPYTIDLATAQERILAKRQADAERLIKEFPEDPELQVLNGRWGPYLAKGKTNYKLPKGTDAKSLTYADCLKIMEEAGDKPAKGRGRFAKKEPKAAAAKPKKTTKKK